MSRFLFVRWILALSLMSLTSSAVAKGQEVNLCLFSLSPGILQANASFSAIYDFDVDKNGVPVNIKPLAQEFTKPADAQACIGEWRLPQSASKHLVATFEWHHGVGWTGLAISGPGMKLRVHLSGQRCPYCSAAQDEAKSSETSPK
jgi:hypothetical protein